MCMMKQLICVNGSDFGIFDFKYAMVLSVGLDDGSMCYSIIMLDSETGRRGQLVFMTSPTPRAL